MGCTASSVCRTARSRPRGGVLFCLQLPRQVSVICDNRHYAPGFLIARVSMLQQPKYRDENYVAAQRPHHDQRVYRVDRVRCRPSGNRIVLPFGLPYKTRSAVILGLRQDEAISLLMTRSGRSLDWRVPEVLVQEGDGPLEGISRGLVVIRAVRSLAGKRMCRADVDFRLAYSI